MTEQLPEGKPPARQAGVVSSFANFLPPEYQSGFSSDWLMGLSPFEDRTCSFCYSVKEGRWVAFGPKKADERLLICERTGYAVSGLAKAQGRAGRKTGGSESSVQRDHVGT